MFINARDTFEWVVGAARGRTDAVMSEHQEFQWAAQVGPLSTQTPPRHVTLVFLHIVLPLVVLIVAIRCHPMTLEHPNRPTRFR